MICSPFIQYWANPDSPIGASCAQIVAVCSRDSAYSVSDCLTPDVLPAKGEQISYTERDSGKLGDVYTTRPEFVTAFFQAWFPLKCSALLPRPEFVC